MDHKNILLLKRQNLFLKSFVIFKIFKISGKDRDINYSPLQ